MCFAWHHVQLSYYVSLLRQTSEWGVHARLHMLHFDPHLSLLYLKCKFHVRSMVYKQLDYCRFDRTY